MTRLHRLLHPIREGRRTRQIGRNSTSNHRWIVGGKLAYLVNQLGLIVAWDGGTANRRYARVGHWVSGIPAEQVVVASQRLSHWLVDAAGDWHTTLKLRRGDYSPDLPRSARDSLLTT